MVEMMRHQLGSEVSPARRFSDGFEKDSTMLIHGASVAPVGVEQNRQADQGLQFGHKANQDGVVGQLDQQQMEFAGEADQRSAVVGA